LFKKTKDVYPGCDWDRSQRLYCIEHWFLRESILEVKNMGLGAQTEFKSQLYSVLAMQLIT
jgi:hypothetical protein